MQSKDELLKKLQEIGYPKPTIISCKPFTIDFIVSDIETCTDKKEFYAHIFRWFFTAVGKPVAKSILGIEKDDDARLATFGEIRNLAYVKNLLKYLAQSAPGFLIDAAKKYLPKKTVEYIRCYISKIKPRELLICDKLRREGILSLILLEDTLEYGTVIRFSVNPVGWVRKIIDNPAIASEFLVSAKMIEWIVTNNEEKLIFVYEDNQKRNLTIIAEISSLYDEKIIKKLRDMLDKFSKLESYDIENIINVFESMI